MAGDLQYKTWMADLPEELTRVPLCSLAIPGSHDSGTYWLDNSAGVALDQPGTVQSLGKCCCGTAIIYRWSVTQHLTIKQQLETGIRYLDIRLCGRPQSPDVHVVHGLYGHTLREITNQVREFLEENSREFVIIDINHFYNMTAVDHRHALHHMKLTFSDKLLGIDTTMSLWNLTLENIWKTKARVMIFYDHHVRNEFSEFWSRDYIQTPWANTANPTELTSFLEHNYNNNHRYGNGELYVWQGVLTAGTATILGHLCSSLENTISTKATRAFLRWLKDKIPSHVGINICSVDFVEKHDFVASVLSLNKNIQV